MIADLVEADLLRRLTARTESNLALELQRLRARDETARSGAELAGITEREAEAARAAMQAWHSAEADEDLGRREPIALPRSAIPSLLQTAYEEFFRAAEMTAAEPSAQGLSPTEIPTTDVALDSEAREFLLGNRAYFGGRWLTRMAERDLRFLTWGAAAKIATRLAGGKRYFMKQPPAPIPIENRARVLLVGDWGSGIPRAVQVGSVMHQAVLDGIAAGRQCHVIHLGDVYYTGQRGEYDRRFLDPWPVKPGQASTVGSYCLNGNHDMYSGGYDYFDHVLADKRFARQDRCSFFCLENEHWRILGLDSAYQDADLYGPQADWIGKTLRRTPKKKAMLLSHHQLFSAWEKVGPQMANRVGDILDERLVTGWFWGHEHRCALYDQFFNVKYPRMAGHGGVPVWAPTKATPAGVAYEFRESFPAYVDEDFARFGFVQLDFEGEYIDVSYIKEQGFAHKTERME